MIRMFLVLFSVILFSSLNFPSQATTIRLEIPTCKSVFGDIWGEGTGDVSKREIDGTTIASVADFTRMTQIYDAGVKIVKGGDFTGWDFRKTSLHSVCFEESKLVDANMTGVHGSGAGFIKTDLSGANMRGAIMNRVMFRNANLKDVSAQGANFSGGQFDGGWFEGSVAGWNLDGANMSDFRFDCGITLPDGCPVYQGGDPVSAQLADFTRANLHSFALHNMNMESAILDQTIVGPEQIADIDNAFFQGGMVLRGGRHEVKLSRSEFGQIMFNNAEWKAVAATPSFECAKASNEAEHYICGEYGETLRHADRELELLYERARGLDGSVRSSQLTWLRERNRCGLQEYPYLCLTESYAARKGDLLAMIGEEKWLEPQAEALFIDEVLPVLGPVQQSDLYNRITPVLIGSSMSEILLKRGKDGLYSIRGRSVGANAHTCNIGASGLYFDKKSGWYVPVSEGDAMPIFRIFEGRLELFENGRPDYEKYPDAANYMSCGARASFGEMIRINVDEETLAKVRKSLSETM